MSKHKEQPATKDERCTAHILFNVLAVLLLIYLVYTIFNTYQQLVEYCESNNTTIGAQWEQAVSAILAAAIPCLVYSSTAYGIGIIIKNQHRSLSNK